MSGSFYESPGIYYCPYNPIAGYCACPTPTPRLSDDDKRRIYNIKGACASTNNQQICLCQLIGAHVEMSRYVYNYGLDRITVRFQVQYECEGRRGQQFWTAKVTTAILYGMSRPSFRRHSWLWKISKGACKGSTGLCDVDGD